MAVVWQFAIIELDKKTLFTGVILEEIPFVYQKQISKFQNLQKLIRSYFIQRAINQKITIRIGEEKVQTQTDKYGSFFVAIDNFKQNPVSITLSDDFPLEIIQKYPIKFKNTSGTFDVISDIDDTIIVSYSANFYKRIKTLLTNSPKDRSVVRFTSKLFEVFCKKNARIFYISKSESNLFNMLTTFIEHNNLPKGSLILTPYLKFHELFLSKKGKDFKINYIRFILENSENKKFVLLGDDSQKDLEVYTIIAEEYPIRILKIFIRQTNKIRPKSHGAFWKKLQAMEIPTKYFKSMDDVGEEINLF
ncbi:MAG: phosphatase domain-containing protein [Eudoraea sp.]|uniref:phosphatase domain-containing protein n=1 Tax=Eudoraea sp. TaxID=1979955 RepID=UPI003C706FCF